MPITVQIIKGRLFWYSNEEPPKNILKSFYFNIDDKLVYQNINQDFGPLNLGKTIKYVTQLQRLMNTPECQILRIYHYTSTEPQKVANSAYLMGAYQIISLGLTAQAAFQPFRNVEIKPFRDAGYDKQSYQCTLLDCLNGLEYAIKLGWLHYKTFNLAEYEYYSEMQNGDLNWIIPKKIIAFSSPSQTSINKYGNCCLTVDDYPVIFQKLGITSVIRVSQKTYNSADFTKYGIKFQEMYFPDNDVPSIDLVRRFLQYAQNQKGPIAVHCKAGLGRTGTLIACYALKHYYFPAAALIGWVRIARPGSIIGSQQEWLLEMQSQLRAQGANSPIWKKARQLVNQKEVLSRMHKNPVNISAAQKEDELKNTKTTNKGFGTSKLKRQMSIISNEGSGMSKLRRQISTNIIVKEQVREKEFTISKKQ